MDVHDGGVAAPPSSDISCSICLELVSYTGDRSRAKLQCGHEFHLDCIGSAFNMKGAMQCPICQKIEEGQWLYSNGSTPSLPEPNMENLDDDEDDYVPVYSEMHVRTQWCPFGEYTRVDSSSEEVESPSIASAAQGSSTGEPNASTRSRSFPHHSSFEHGSRAGSSFVSSSFSRHPGSNSHAHGLIQTSVVYYRQPNHFNQQHFNQSRVPAPVVPGMTRAGGFYVYPPSSSSGQNLHEAESSYPNNYSSLERERSSHFPTVTRVTGWGGYF